MLSSPDLSFSRSLPIDVFNQLGELLQQMQLEAVGSAALVLTEAVLAQIMNKSEWQKQKFTLVVSEQFSALLVGNQEENVEMCFTESFPDLNNVSLAPVENEIEREFIPVTQNATLYASLTFNSEAIASFISQLKDSFAHDSHTHQHLERYLQIPSLRGCLKSIWL